MTSILKVSEIQDPTNSNTALTIDSSGRVTTPARPFINLLHNTDTNYAVPADITDWRVHDSRGITHSSGVITVPVDGLYKVGINGISDTLGGIYLNVNGSNIFRIGYASLGTGEIWSAIGGDTVLSLTASDQVKFQVSNGTVGFYGHTGNLAVGCAYMYLIG